MGERARVEEKKRVVINYEKYSSRLCHGALDFRRMYSKRKKKILLHQLHAQQSFDRRHLQTAELYSR